MDISAAKHTLTLQRADGALYLQPVEHWIIASLLSDY